MDGLDDYADYSGVSAVFWHPIWFFRLLHVPVFSHATLAALVVAWRVSLLLAAVGLWTRVATATSFLLAVYIYGLEHSFGYIKHSDAIVVFVMAGLALSRCGEGWSVDRLLRIARGRAASVAPSGEYTWPIRFVWVVMSAIFFAAGVSKLRHSGLAWIGSDTFQGFLIQSSYPLARGAGIPWTDWGIRIARMPMLCRVMAAASMATELGFPLAIFSRRLRYPLAAVSFAFLLGVTALMGPDFYAFLVCYLFWVPWDRLAEEVKQRLAPGRRAASASS